MNVKPDFKASGPLTLSLRKGLLGRVVKFKLKISNSKPLLRAIYD